MKWKMFISLSKKLACVFSHNQQNITFKKDKLTVLFYHISSLVVCIKFDIKCIYKDSFFASDFQRNGKQIEKALTASNGKFYVFYLFIVVSNTYLFRMEPFHIPKLTFSLVLVNKNY